MGFVQSGSARRLPYLAYWAVHSRETRTASASFSFQCDATSFARGSSCRHDE